MLDLSVDHMKHRKFAVKISVLCLIPLAWVLMLVVALYSNFKTSQAMMAASIYQLLHNLFYVCQFSCAALAVKDRFAILNNYLERFILDPGCYKIEQKALDLKLFTELYNKLCDILQVISSTFTLHLIIVMLNFTAVEIFGGYGIVREVLLPSRNVLNLIASFVWILSQYPIKFFMASSGSSTTEEAEKSLVLISKIITSTGEHDQEYKNALNIVLHQMQVREKRLSNIFFNIDYNIILAVRKWHFLKFDVQQFDAFLADVFDCGYLFGDNLSG